MLLAARELLVGELQLAARHQGLVALELELRRAQLVVDELHLHLLAIERAVTAVGGRLVAADVGV